MEDTKIRSIDIGDIAEAATAVLTGPKALGMARSG
jgi:hypothetical protein